MRFWRRRFQRGIQTVSYYVEFSIFSFLKFSLHLSTWLTPGWSNQWTSSVCNLTTYDKNILGHQVGTVIDLLQFHRLVLLVRWSCRNNKIDTHNYRDRVSVDNHLLWGSSGESLGRPERLVGTLRRSRTPPECVTCGERRFTTLFGCVPTGNNGTPNRHSNCIMVHYAVVMCLNYGPLATRTDSQH